MRAGFAPDSRRHHYCTRDWPLRHAPTRARLNYWARARFLPHRLRPDRGANRPAGRVTRSRAVGRTPGTLSPGGGRSAGSAVAVLRSDDLHAHGKAVLGKPDGRRARGQVSDPGMARPEKQVQKRHLLPVDIDHALKARAVVVGEGCLADHRAK